MRVLKSNISPSTHFREAFKLPPHARAVETRGRGLHKLGRSSFFSGIVTAVRDIVQEDEQMKRNEPRLLRMVASVSRLSASWFRVFQA